MNPKVERTLKCKEFPCELVKEFKEVSDYPDLDTKSDSYKKLCKAIDNCPKRVDYKGLKFCHVETTWR